MLFFYVLSIKLSKADFGMISWASATAMTLTVVLSFGLEQVVTRRVATSHTSSSTWAFLLHALVSATVLGLVLFALRFIVHPSVDSRLYWLPWFFAVQGFMFIGSPLKVTLNAKERFAPYALIVFISNSLKVALVVIWTAWQPLTIEAALYVLCICSVFEFLALLVFTLLRNPFSTRLRLLAYRKLLLEAAPQFLAVLCDTSLARFSWILLGLLVADVAAVADYSFVYRAYEVGKMPVLMVGMLLLPRLSRFAGRRDEDKRNLSETLNLVLSAEMLVAFAFVLAGNIVWSPWVDALTSGRYGTPNELIFLILSLCIPSQFAINLMWTALFAEKQYKQLSRITIITGVVNLGAAFLLIPRLQAMGAAVAFLLATLVQTALYYRQVRTVGMQISLRPMVHCLLLAAISGSAVKFLPWSTTRHLLIAAIIYISGAFLTGLLRRTRLQALQGYLTR